MTFFARMKKNTEIDEFKLHSTRECRNCYDYLNDNGIKVQSRLKYKYMDYFRGDAIHLYQKRLID